MSLSEGASTGNLATANDEETQAGTAVSATNASHTGSSSVRAGATVKNVSNVEGDRGTNIRKRLLVSVPLADDRAPRKAEGIRDVSV